jgi:arylamine N-acetyltransferase
MKRHLSILLTLLLLPACTTHLQRKEQFLTEAGFRAVTPSTPAQIAHLHSLPQGHITQVTHKGKQLFLLADSKKNLLLVGSNSQYEKYQHILYTKEVEPDIANEKAIKLEQADWADWGGYYGPMGGPFYGPMFY